MKMPCEIIWKKRSIHWNFYGAVSLDNVLLSFKSLYGDSRFDDTRYQVRDFRAAIGDGINVEDMQTIAAYDRAASLSNPTMKIAWVSPESESAAALAALHSAELYDTNWEVEVFHSLEEALEWAI